MGSNINFWGKNVDFGVQILTFGVEQRRMGPPVRAGGGVLGLGFWGGDEGVGFGVRGVGLRV